MITLYTGVPGAGKTYKMVADLDAFIADYQSKATTDTGPLTVITNIRELKLPHIDFDELILERFPDKSLKVTDRIELFFDYDYQKSLNDHFGGPLMYLIDECQTFFPRRKSLPNTEAYLQRHRHLGHNIYLATQALRQVNGNVVCLVELEYFAAPRTKSLFGEFRYHVKTPNSRDIINVKNIKPQQRIFELYKSFDANELQKPKKLLLRKLWPVLLVPVAIVMLYVGLGRISNPQGKETAAVKPQVAAAIGAPSSALAPTRSGPSEETLSKVLALQKQVDDLQKRLYDVERVFLMVVKTGDRKITIDPDTNAIVDVTKIKHKVICAKDGLTCYFDRPINSAVKVAGTAINNAMSPGVMPGSSTSFPWPVRHSTEPESKAGPGSFIDASMFEDLK
jgi:Zonula occludens toxin